MDSDSSLIDKNLYWTGAIFLVGLLLLGAIWWKAAAVAATMSVCWYLTYGRRIIIMVGMILLLVGFSEWLGFLPTSFHMPQLWALIQK